MSSSAASAARWKSSSSMNSPAEKWSAGSGATGCTRRSKPRSASPIKQETQTLATITLQNFFKLYKSLSRHDRHRPDRSRGIQQDLPAGSRHDPDQSPGHPPGQRRPRLPQGGGKSGMRSSTRSRPFSEAGRPVLVGTTSVEKSEMLSTHAEAQIRHRS